MNERDLLASELALARLRSEEWEAIPTPELRSLVEAASEETFTTHIGPEGVLFWQLYEGEEFEAESEQEALSAAAQYLLEEFDGEPV